MEGGSPPRTEWGSFHSRAKVPRLARENHIHFRLPGPRGQSRVWDTIGDVTVNLSIYVGLMEAG